MNNLAKTLLGGVAVCALAVVPAIAQNTSTFHITALHGGRVVNKTRMPNHGATHVTYTYGVYGYEPASTPLGTKWNVFMATLCPIANKIKVPKKTSYGKISLQVETYSRSCENVEATYKLVKQPSPGATDSFVISTISKYEQNGTKYKATLNLDTTITFD